MDLVVEETVTDGRLRKPPHDGRTPAILSHMIAPGTGVRTCVLSAGVISGAIAGVFLTPLPTELTVVY